MSTNYNNTLQDNNNLLEDILNAINNLPEQEEIILQSKTVSPTTSQQIITPDANYDGLDKVTVNAATKQSKTVSPSTSAQTITPDNGYYGLSSVTVNAATKQSKTVTPSASAQTITPDNGYYGLSSVTVNGDSDLVASNIKSGVNIFGVTGSYSSSPTIQTANITTSMISQQYVDLSGDYRVKITFPVPKSKLISFFLFGTSGSANLINYSYFSGFRGQSVSSSDPTVYDQQWDGFSCQMYNGNGTVNSSNQSGRTPMLVIDDDYSILTLMTPADWQKYFAYNRKMQYTYMV